MMAPRHDPDFRLHRFGELRVLRHYVPGCAQPVLVPPDTMAVQERLPVAPAERHDQIFDGCEAIRRMYVAVPGGMNAVIRESRCDIGKRRKRTAPDLYHRAVAAFFRERLMDGFEHAPGPV
jgi:hypothetical protein